MQDCNSDLEYKRETRNKYMYKKWEKSINYSCMYSAFHSVIMLFALFLSFKCNNGFVPLDFLFACCCPVLYILYRAALSPNFCNLINNVVKST